MHVENNQISCDEVRNAAWIDADRARAYPALRHLSNRPGTPCFKPLPLTRKPSSLCSGPLLETIRRVYDHAKQNGSRKRGDRQRKTIKGCIKGG